jgi:hypothetical protein
MAGKYSGGVMDGLPRAAPSDPSFQEKVDLAKRTLTLSTPAELASAYRALRKQKDALDDEAKTLNIQVAAIEQALWDSYEANGISSIKLEDGASVSVQLEPAASVRDHDALRAWAVANGYERSLTMPWQTVNAVAKERLLAGEPSPDGVELAVRTKTVLRKG